MGRARNQTVSVAADVAKRGLPLGRFDALLGAGRGGGLKAGQEDLLPELSFREVVLGALMRAHGHGFFLDVEDEHRWVAVRMVDDPEVVASLGLASGQCYREARSFAEMEYAMDWLAAPSGEKMRGEFLIDLDHREPVCWPFAAGAAGAAGQAGLVVGLGPAVPFTPEHVPFA